MKINQMNICVKLNFKQQLNIIILISFNLCNKKLHYKSNFMTSVAQNPPSEDYGIQIRPYQSKTADETELQIKSMKVKSKRALLKLEFVKKRRDFNQPVKFTDTDSDRNPQFQSFKDESLGFKQNKVMEVGLQGTQPYTSSGSQTFFKRKVNKCLQIDCDAPVIMNEAKVKDQQIMTFLQNVYPQMEGALQSNQTIDIFQNDFDVLPRQSTGNKQSTELGNVIKETKNLFYLKSKGKKVSCIQFQPWLQGRKNIPIIAQAFVQNLSFQDRVIFSMKSSKSYILFWNYEDMHAIDPLLILECPMQILTFEFNPKDPNIVIAGTINGQIVMWDLKNVQLGLPSKKKNKKSEKNEIRQIQPTLMSALQDPSTAAAITDQIKRNVPSHKSPVVSIRWFPQNLQIEMKKSYSTIIQSSGQMNQFTSISTDGQVLLWQKKFIDAHKKPVTDLSNYQWKAGYGFHLFRPEGGGAMGGSFINFKKNQKRTVFTGSSDQGQLFVCDWAARSADETGSKNDTIIQYWNQQRNFRPIVSLDLMPSNEDIILTVYDFYFCVWKVGIQTPIFTSMVTKGSYHTCGCWSPSRAGVIFIGKSNGTVDIWDFMDQSHKWTIQYSVGSVGISSMKFHENNQNILAVGSQEGTLHILELPFTLVRKIGDEDKTMNQFWQRQIQSVKYFDKRLQRRFEQSQQLRAKQELQQRQRIEKEEKKEKKNDQQKAINLEYDQFAQAFLNQFVYGIKPEPKEQQKEVKNPGRR